MQNTRLRLVGAIAALLTASTLLSACTSSSHNSVSRIPNGQPTPGNLPINTDSSPVAVKPHLVYPAVGRKHGVIKHGVSVETNPDKGIAYTCARDLRTVRVPYLQTVDYNGTQITFDDDSINIGTAEKPDYYQSSASITFKGAVKTLKAVSLIVQTSSDNIGTEKHPWYPNTDEHVVNLNQKWINSAGIQLPTSDFGSGIDTIDGVRICVKP